MNRAQLRRVAAARALHARHALGFAPDAAVDVFEAIRRANLWLMFQPMDNLFGLYIREPPAAGVVLNVKVHPALQRFTASHELGHHMLGHDSGLDPELNVTRWAQLGNNELAAQFFAAEFLMPLPAMNRAVNALALDRNSFDETAVYQLSLRLGTSYSAMITRLATVQWIGRPAASSLQRVQPQAIKRRILGRRLADSRSDVWLLGEEESGSEIRPLVGDELCVQVEEIPSSGRRWLPDVTAGLRLERDARSRARELDEKVVYGRSSRRRLEIKVTDKAHGSLRLALTKPWLPTRPERTIELTVTSERRPERGIDAAQQSSLLAS